MSFLRCYCWAGVAGRFLFLWMLIPLDCDEVAAIVSARERLFLLGWLSHKVVVPLLPPGTVGLHGFGWSVACFLCSSLDFGGPTALVPSDHRAGGAPEKQQRWVSTQLVMVWAAFAMSNRPGSDRFGRLLAVHSLACVKRHADLAGKRANPFLGKVHVDTSTWLFCPAERAPQTQLCFLRVQRLGLAGRVVDGRSSSSAGVRYRCRQLPGWEVRVGLREAVWSRRRRVLLRGREEQRGLRWCRLACGCGPRGPWRRIGGHRWIWVRQAHVSAEDCLVVASDLVAALPALVGVSRWTVPLLT